MSYLTKRINVRLRADYYVRRASSEIHELQKRRLVVNPAMYWPEMPAKHLSGIRTTQELSDTKAYQIYDEHERRWPKDLAY